MQDDPLTQLRGLALPAEPTFWPPAPGWWGVLALVLMMMIGAWLWWRRHRRRAPQRRLKQATESELQRLQGLLQQAQYSSYLREADQLLRRVLKARGEASAASLSGAAWQARLQSAVPAAPLADWALLAQHRYQPGVLEADWPQLHAQVQAFVQAQLPRSGRC